MAEIEYIWKDRRRVLGMPITFTRYALSEDRLFLETGFASVRADEVLLYRVRDISLNISLWQRIFGVGTVTVYSSDKSLPVLVLKNIRAPRATKETIHQQVEQMKLSRKMRVSELLSDRDDDDDNDGIPNELDDDYNP